MENNNIEIIENAENTDEKKENKFVAWLKAHRKGLTVGGGVLGFLLGLGAAGAAGYKLGFTDGLDRVGELAAGVAEELPESVANVGESVIDAVESVVE